jgi:hypothetical protein
LEVLISEQSTGESLENTVDTTVTVSRLVSSSPKHLWKLLVTREGAEEATIEVVHSGIPRYFDTAAITRRWETALDALASAAAAEMVSAG